MGQGNSEGNAPEDTTPDAAREQADDAAPVSPNSPTPTEADAATRQDPVVQDVVDDAADPHAETIVPADVSASEPGAVEPGADKSGSDGPGDDGPGADKSGSDVPVAGTVGADEPGAEGRGAVATGADGTGADQSERPTAGDGELPRESEPSRESEHSREPETEPAPAAEPAPAVEPAPTPAPSSSPEPIDASPVAETPARTAVPASDDTRTRSTPVDPAGDPRTRAAAALAAAAAAAAAEVDARSASDSASATPADAPVTPGSTESPNTPPATAPAADAAPATAAMPATAATTEIAATPTTTAATPTTTAAPMTAATPVAAAGTPEEGSPLDVFESEPTRNRRWWRPVLIVAGVLVVLGGAYVGGAYALADRVPRGTTVAGIEVGGMSAADARTALTDGLAARSSQPITVTAREVSGTLDPATAGLRLDVDATVDALTGIDLRPQRMWQHLAGGGEEQPVTAVDEQALDAAVQDLAGVLMLEPVDGSVVFVDGAPQGVAAVDGWSLDAEGARSTLEDGWLTEALPIELPSDTVAPTITQDEVDRVVRDVASAVVSGPVTVSVADQSAELPVDVLVGAASFVPQESELVLQMDGASLVNQVVTRTSDLLTTAADATFQFQDGAPVIVPGTPGTTLDPATVGTAVATAAESTSERTAAVELVESDPSQSTEALQALGVTSAISEFSTPLTSEPKRTQNITAGAAAINGTLIRPGETFSLTEALGPIDAAHGFVQAGAIVNGEHSDAWGGGLSQLSTTTFNAAFEAGMEDVEHTPHSEWFTRYPAGREATLYTGSIDMKWKNTTPYGVLVQAYVADGKTWVRLWSTPYYEVSISSGAKTNVVSPTTVYNTSPTCSASSAGNPGFSISVTRTVSLNGEVQGTDNLSWRYKAQNKVICGADPATAAPAG
ncbi:VanW family protein [Cellulomonas sp. RIT-PI-Y]|uniref:VanW family protein n=1 Tax=Cellulomonas sp. RIT-PI-Y TaxID=3035297 RepID=UPI0021DA4236|nr:VanW family protein [Cellulomonas sp. RIT-PI-Y]